MSLQQIGNQTQPGGSLQCAHAERSVRRSCDRPFPSVRRLRTGRRYTGSSGAALIAISQRDDTVVLPASDARRLAAALLRAARRR